MYLVFLSRSDVTVSFLVCHTEEETQLCGPQLLYPLLQHLNQKAKCCPANFPLLSYAPSSACVGLVRVVAVPSGVLLCSGLYQKKQIHDLSPHQNTLNNCLTKPAKSLIHGLHAMPLLNYVHGVMLSSGGRSQVQGGSTASNSFALSNALLHTCFSVLTTET